MILEMIMGQLDALSPLLSMAFEKRLQILKEALLATLPFNDSPVAIMKNWLETLLKVGFLRLFSLELGLFLQNVLVSVRIAVKLLFDWRYGGKYSFLGLLGPNKVGLGFYLSDLPPESSEKGLFNYFGVISFSEEQPIPLDIWSFPADSQAVIGQR